MVVISGTVIATAIGIATVCSLLAGGMGIASKSIKSLRKENDILLNTTNAIIDNENRLVGKILEMESDAKILSNELVSLRKNISKLAETTPIPGFEPLFQSQDQSPKIIRTPKIIKSHKPRRLKRSSPWGGKSPTSKKVLTELTDDASVDSSPGNPSSYQTQILESGLISPQLGLVMEQTGSYMEYSGYIYVPIIYHMPHLAASGLVGGGVDCNITANKDHQKMIIGLLKEKIGTLIPQRQSIRTKRFIATLLLGGVTAWNRASIWSLQDTVTSLDNQIKTMQEHQQIVTSSINTLIDNQHAIHHAVDRQARIMREFMDRSTCTELITNYFREVYSTWLSLAPNDFARVVDSALSGKITPDLLPATDVISVLLKHPSIVSTAYSKDMTLLYELGKFSLHQVNYNPYPMVSGIMIFPRILMDRSAALMKVHTTHLSATGGFRKLKLPDVVACKTKGDCWEISPTACKEMLTLTLCPKTTKIEFNSCLKHLITDNHPTTQCEWNLATDASLEIVPFDGGVLISASNSSGEIMISQGKELIVHKSIEPSPNPIVLTSSDGDYLHMGGQIYQLSQETLRTGYEIVINLTIPVQKESLDSLTVDGWVEESHIPNLRTKPWSPPSHYTWWVLIGLAVVILTLIAVLIRYRIVLQKLHTRVKKEISGWVSVPSAPPQYQRQLKAQQANHDFIV